MPRLRHLDDPSEPGRQPSLVLAVLLAALTMMAVASCSRDPEAASRDRASDEARQIAEKLDLPDGYRKGAISEYRAQTPSENRGGGQSGQVIVAFDAPPGTSFDQALHAFDAWALARGYVRVEFNGGNVCTSSGVGSTWGSKENIVQLIYSGDGGRHNSVTIPYGTTGLATLGHSTASTITDLPTCP